MASVTSAARVVGMKLTLDPMPALRMSAKAKVNLHFNGLAQPHRDAAHAMKRTAADAGAPFPGWFAAEADLRGVTPVALASMIASKPDTVAERELHRQRVMAAVDAAKTPAELDQITKAI
jgi:hypothetical protein